MMEMVASTIRDSIASGTILALAGLGLLVNERVGVINLGAEGMMLVAAVTGYAVGVETANPWYAFGAGALAAVALAVIFAWLTIWLNANQYATGLAITLLGGGVSAYVGVSYVGRQLEIPRIFAVPGLSELPFVGLAFFQEHPLVYGTVLLVPGLWFLFWKTRTGLILRAIGESPDAAHALGYPVRRVRLAAVLAGGVLCGLAGTFISVVYTGQWTEGMVRGRGWVALALTVFATWRPTRLLLGAYLFGGLTVVQLSLQAHGVQVPSEFMSMVPYLSTILVLVLISRNPAWIRLNMPASLGKPFFPSQ
jgi:simple sugar transport system permease protein